MRKLKTALIFVAVVIVMLVWLVVFKLGVQRQEMAARGPLTVDEVSKIAAKWRPAAEANPAEPSQSTSIGTDSGQTAKKQTAVTRSEESSTADRPPTTRDTSSVQDASSAPTGTPAASRPPLRRTLTQGEREREATQFRQNNKRRFGTILVPSMEFIATAGLSAGLDEGESGGYYYEAASIAYHSGDWATAKRLCRQAIGHPIGESFRQECCVHLAWMEDDPQVADKLLELACPEDGAFPWVLAEATRLAFRTGSRESFEYYVTRLQAVSPQWAEEFRSLRWSGEPDRKSAQWTASSLPVH